MSEDRELLEWAAKAAGLEFKWRDGDLAWGPEHVGPAAWINECWQPWSPLTDDGPALRLAVKLRMELSIDPMYSWAMAEHDLHAGNACENGSDPYAATRRAIVRAAAEIGRASTGEKP